MTDYSKLTDAEMDALMATRVMRWYLHRCFHHQDHVFIEYWCYDGQKDMDGGPLEATSKVNWHPTHDLNQAWMCVHRMAKSNYVVHINGAYSKTRDASDCIAAVWISKVDPETGLVLRDTIDDTMEYFPEPRPLKETARAICEAILMAMDKEE